MGYSKHRSLPLVSDEEWFVVACYHFARTLLYYRDKVIRGGSEEDCWRLCKLALCLDNAVAEPESLLVLRRFEGFGHAV